MQFATVFTKIAGNHTIKFGEDFRHTRDFLLQTQDNGGPRGQFQFRANQTSIPSDAAATAGFRQRLRVVPARRPLARAARSQGDRPGRALLGVLHLHPGQVGGDAEADDRPRPAARASTRRSSAWSIREGSRTTIRRRTRCRSPATATSAGASACRAILKNFGPRAGASYRVNDKTVAARRLRRQHAAVPRQRLRLQLPGEAEQRVQRAEQLSRPAGSMKNGFPDPVFVTDSVERDRRREPGGAAERELLPRRGPTCTKGRCTSFNVAFQRELPGRFLTRRRVCRQPRPRRPDAVQRERRERRRPSREQRPAAVPARSASRRT